MPSRRNQHGEHRSTRRRTRFVETVAGYPIDIFRTIAAVSLAVRKLLTPISRVALVALLWLNRHTVALWYRSIRDEVSTHGADTTRLRRLVRALWTVSRDRRTAHAEALRSIAVRPQGFEFEARSDWPGTDVVEDLLAPIPPYPTETSLA